MDPALALVTAPSRGCLTCRVSPSCLTDTLVKSDSLEFFASSYNLILMGRVFCRHYSREEYFDVLKIPDYKQFESLIGKSRQSRHTILHTIMLMTDSGIYLFLNERERVTEGPFSDVIEIKKY